MHQTVIPQNTNVELKIKGAPQMQIHTSRAASSSSRFQRADTAQLLTFCFLLVFSSCRIAYAVDQGAARASSDDSQTDVLATIIVTATKRAEDVSKVPISIAAMTSEQLAQSGIKNIRDVAALVPGIEFDLPSSYGPNLINIAIRGVNGVIGTSTTGIYLDDTAIQSRVQSLSYIGQPLPVTWDLARVEVDRGPQGTLFGAGAEGGTVRFIPTAPSLTRYSGIAHTEVSDTKGGGVNYEQGVAAGGPLIDNTLGGRVSFLYRKDSGYIDRVNPFTGAVVDSDSNRSDSKAGRVALAYQPMESLTITPSVSYQSLDTHDVGIFYVGLSNPQQGDFVSGKLLAQPTEDTFYLPSLKVEADLAFASFTSVSSYYHRHVSWLWDNTNGIGAILGGYGNPLGPAYPTSADQAAPATISMKQNLISQELRLASSDPHAQLRWVGGLFYSRTRQDDALSVDSSYFSTLFQTSNPVLSTDQNVTDTQIAAFGQIDYRPMDRLTLTAGVRVADVKYEAYQFAGGFANTGVPPYGSGSSRETPVTPKGGISFQVDPDNLLYLSVGKGYRQGGINDPLPSYCGTNTGPKSYHSDSLWSYEVGAKDVLFGGRVQLDSSAFHIDWRNMQQEVIIPICEFDYIANLSTAKINGFDVAFAALLGAHIKPALAVSYINARYSSTVESNGVVIVAKDDTIGITPQIPSPWNITASLEYAMGIQSDWKLTYRVEDAFHSKNTGPYASYNPASISYAPLIPPNSSTNVINARVTATYKQFDFEAFVNNAANSAPLLNRGQDLVTSTLIYSATLRPRTVGLGGSWHF